MVHEGADWNPGGKLRHSSHVVGVVVRHDQVIDPFHSRQFGGGDNAVSVAAAGIRPAGIHQHRVPQGRDEERGLAALHIDEVHFQCPGGARRSTKKKEENSGDGCSHGGILTKRI